MFVLCPHCHFLVGMDPRTGGPPAVCPKCGGTVVEPVAAKAADAAPLDPFAPAALPSVAPTLPPAAPDEMAEEAAQPAATARGAEATEASRATTAAASTPAGADAEVRPESPDAAAAPPDAGAPSPSRPSADDMIAALAARPERKPRAPRSRRNPAARAPDAATVDADASAAVAEPATPTPSPPPSAAATFGARLRQWFARAPRQPDAARTATTPAEPPAPSPATATEATPATPPLSIRNRRRRTAPKATESVSASGEPATGLAATPVADDAAPAPSPAVATTTGGAAMPAEAPADSEPLTGTPAASDSVTRAPVESAPLESASLAGEPIAGETREGAPADRASDTGASTVEPGPPEAAAPPLPEGTATGADKGPAPGTAELPVAPPENIDAAASALVAAMPAPAPAAATPHPARPAPSFATPRAGTRPARRDYRAVAAALALATLLGLQLLLAQRAALAADPGWRPTIAALCALLRCELPPWREPAAFTMLNRHVRPHPDAPGTLLIDASFRNDARWAQPWPRLELTLADVDGRTVGTRTFEAREYLGAAPTQTELAPGQAASLSLAVVEPAPDIVSFTFDFR